MATGIEVAGLLLAVLPIFISAAEHYKDGIGFVKRAVKKEMFAEQYRDELTQQRTLLALYVKGVLGKTSLSPKTQLALIDDLTGETWRRPDVVQEVQAELGDAYQPFLDVISRICKVLGKQIKDVSGITALDEDEVIQRLQSLCLEQHQTSTAEKKTKIFERLKFSWKAPERAMILAEFQACNSKLDKLSVAADRAKPYERKQQTRKVHEAFERREEIQKLFEVMKNACKCQPSGQREVGLRLQAHRSPDDAALDSNFQMIFFHSQDIIYELSAKIEKVASEEPRKKKVRIAGTDKQPDVSINTPDPKMKVLEDICKEITLAHSCKCCLELVVDKHEKVYCQPRQVMQTWSQTTPQQLLSLTEIMSELRLYDHKRWLYREKSILAIILAYSLLQLHDSPWSRAQWRSEDITFINTSHVSGSQPSKDLHYQLRQPYTRAQVAAAAAPATTKTTLNPTSTQSKSSSHPPRRNAHLHALGVVLLELYLNRSISSDVLAQGSNDYRSVAQDLLEDHADDMTMTPEYLKAVRFCLSPHPNPYSGSFSFDDKGFREIYYMEVIAMVEENLMARFEVGEHMWTMI